MSRRKTKTILGIVIVAIILTIIFATDLFSTKSANAAWYSTSGVWTYRKTIAVNPQKVASTTGPNITSFPMLVSVIDPELKYTSFGGNVASSTGGDIIFTNADGTTLLNYEIEKYASTTGELVAWVNIPFLSSTSTTPIYMYYGNASATNNQNPAGVWDANYKGVWHLGNNTSLSLTDSTSNNRTLTNNASVAYIAGEVGGAASFSGSNSLTNSTAWSNFISVGTGTIEAWANPQANGCNGGSVYQCQEVVGDNNNGYLGIKYGGPTGAASLHQFFAYNFTSGTQSVETAGTIGTWQHLVWVHSGGNLYLYSNGSLVSSVASGNTGLLTATVDIGGNTFNGYVDDVKVSNTARSADWIATEYNNQAFPSRFYSYGGSENYNGRVDSSGSSTSAFEVKGGTKVRGGVKFR